MRQPALRAVGARLASAVGARLASAVGAGLATAVIAGLAGCQPPRAGTAAAAPEMDALVARCVEAMAREVCVAQKDHANSSSPAASQVFVAGVGQIDAQAYNEIRSSGEAMCGLVKTRCSGGWNDSACVAARSIWPAPGRS